ncbi:dTMP kinase [Methanonatronarchaeum sp. AMET6-2]|uniref:dTMP kinase n=1 Tax=Methanonatronarchaeum sp. AMET6-2 TaxID=2933293 RepID=UPI001206C4BE|nr:dTMP kinase [Methanonatronarchaeum sp. AMET6-2]RZN61091.1 MAG: dTMP kinase [Methanonatronarchaeia archaeon]UOY09358.1 dTMP kinase [Methanonatronarchaeum sp. AMET6-2]
MKGYLITVEGIDGSGKSSLVNKLGALIGRETNREVLLTKEPTESWVGDAVRRGLQTDIDPLSEAFLFTADHIHHVKETIKPGLQRGKVIISDRYSDSFYAYQGTTLQNQIENPVQYLRNLRSQHTVKPDATILIQIDPEKSVSRLKHEQIKFENEEFLRKVSEIYNDLASEEKNRFIEVDGSQPLEKVAEQSIRRLKEKIEL